MRSRQRIANRSITREVRAVDFAHVTEVGRNDRARQRAIEVSNQAQAETARNVSIAAERDLVRTVEQCRAVVPPGLLLSAADQTKS